MITKESLKKYFDNFNGGKGLDHWSPSSSQNFTRLLINYSLPQELRRTFKIRYKAPFGNLVNNTAQRLTCETLYQADKKITLKNKDYDDVFQQELDEINNLTPPVDDKDKLGREAMVEAAHPSIKNVMKSVEEIFGKQKIVAERYVSSKSEDMIHDIIGRIDYESEESFMELKTKPPSLKKKRNKDEYYMATTQLPTEPDPNHVSQVAFYYHCTKRKPHLVYVNENEYKIFDDQYYQLSPNYLEERYNFMTQRLKSWEELIIFCKGDINKIAHFAEPPELNHPFYYRDLIDEQKQQIKNLWGLDT
tara:strand:- start:149 stop:1063 length:915 start_codon:yes stop_codon:yes gene_type:complete